MMHPVGVVHSLPNQLPTGTVTFLFTDIVGSTALWERDPVARVLLFLGHVADRQGDLAGARGRFEEALAIGRQTANAPLIGSALINLGIIADQQGDYARAVERYDEGLAIFRHLGDR